MHTVRKEGKIVQTSDNMIDMIEGMGHIQKQIFPFIIYTKNLCVKFVFPSGVEGVWWFTSTVAL